MRDGKHPGPGDLGTKMQEQPIRFCGGASIEDGPMCCCPVCDPECHYPYPCGVKRNCSGLSAKKGEPGYRPRRPAGGPGTELKRIFKWFGITPKGGCGCGDHSRKMDRQGPKWCHENMDIIIGWLRKAAKERNLPFVQAAVKGLVLLAIRRSERTPTEKRLHSR